MEKPENPFGLNQYLFWDIDMSTFDIDRSASWLIPRVLEYGQMSDWHFIKHYYGMEKITSICMGVRSLDPVAISFICCLSGKRMEDFRSYRIA